MKALKLIPGKQGDLFSFKSHQFVMYFENCPNNIPFLSSHKYL